MQINRIIIYCDIVALIFFNYFCKRNLPQEIVTARKELLNKKYPKTPTNKFQLMSHKITRRELITQGGLALAFLSLTFPLTSFSKFNTMTDNPTFDVIIIGGSYAGLSAAMSLGRSIKKVLILDSGLPCNRQTPHSHNLITQDGEKPSVIAAKAKNQVLAYETVKFHDGLAVNGKETKDGFTITSEKGQVFKAKKLIFATGIKDIMPNIKGFADCWGISVIHCPYCHGYEYRNKKTALLLNGDKAIHLASLVNNLTEKITVLTNGKATFNEEQFTKLKRHNIPIIEKEVTEIEHENGYLKNVVLRMEARWILRLLMLRCLSSNIPLYSIRSNAK